MKESVHLHDRFTSGKGPLVLTDEEGEPQSWSGRGGEKKNSPPSWESNPGRPPYTLYERVSKSFRTKSITK
jgi:hypothetical protein